MLKVVDAEENTVGDLRGKCSLPLRHDVNQREPVSYRYSQTSNRQHITTSQHQNTNKVYPLNPYPNPPQSNRIPLILLSKCLLTLSSPSTPVPRPSSSPCMNPTLAIKTLSSYSNLPSLKSPLHQLYLLISSLPKTPIHPTMSLPLNSTTSKTTPPASPTFLPTSLPTRASPPLQ